MNNEYSIDFTRSKEDLHKIVKIKIAKLQDELTEQGYLIEFDDGLISELAKNRI